MIIIVKLPSDQALFFGDELDLAWPPALVEERFERAIEPQDEEPSLNFLSAVVLAAIIAFWV